MRRLYDATPGRVPVTPAIRLDLSWFSRFLLKWNGSALIHPSFARKCFAFVSDASDLACGVATNIDSDSVVWSSKLAPLHINIKELWSVYHGLCRWSPSWKGANVVVGCDNTSAVAMKWIRNF
jgi:hypothetical protein